MKYLITLWVDGEPFENHSIELNRGDKGHYVSLMSVQYFSDRENQRLLDAWGKGLKEIPKRCEVQYGARTTNEFKEIPCVAHESLWDFYKAVGYDYKKKKYTETA